MTAADRTRLYLVGRAFVGFEQALAAQAVAFEQAHPGVEVVRRFREPQDLYDSTVAHAELASGAICERYAKSRHLLR